MERFKNSAQRVFDQNLYSTKLSAFNDPLLGFIPSIGLAAVLLYGGNLVIDGEDDARPLHRRSTSSSAC